MPQTNNKTMKKIKLFLNWLFADFAYNVYELIGQKFCLFLGSQVVFALFKNGVEEPNTRFEMTDPVTQLIFANSGPATLYDVFYQFSGNATIQATPTDDIELRCIASSTVDGATHLNSVGDNSVVASLNIEKVSV